MALPTKKLGPLTFRIDRPKGLRKTWPPHLGHPTGRTWVYPCDYGYLPGKLGEDGEGLDAFVGDDPKGPLESFLKLKPGTNGKPVPDETKFLFGLTNAERNAVLTFYGKEVSDLKSYANWGEVLSALEAFKPARKSRYKSKPVEEAKLAALMEVSRVYGVKLAALQVLDGGNVLLDGQGDQSNPGHNRFEENASMQDGLERMFHLFDGKKNSPGGDESAVGSLFDEGVIGG